ncbi:hypothetical protein [Nocardia abscessus]|uniref:hypothetical protein n=1 Tax=Nocardia abscessus TaxID=120957 RepID=UPI0024580F23|nr:hypothetical protein [Nocardia abscessus]
MIYRVLVAKVLLVEPYLFRILVGVLVRRGLYRQVHRPKTHYVYLDLWEDVPHGVEPPEEGADFLAVVTRDIGPHHRDTAFSGERRREVRRILGSSTPLDARVSLDLRQRGIEEIHRLRVAAQLREQQSIQCPRRVRSVVPPVELHIGDRRPSGLLHIETARQSTSAEANSAPWPEDGLAQLAAQPILEPGLVIGSALGPSPEVMRVQVVESAFPHDADSGLDEDATDRADNGGIKAFAGRLGQCAEQSWVHGYRLDENLSTIVTSGRDVDAFVVADFADRDHGAISYGQLPMSGEHVVHTASHIPGRLRLVEADHLDLPRPPRPRGDFDSRTAAQYVHVQPVSGIVQRSCHEVSRSVGGRIRRRAVDVVLEPHRLAPSVQFDTPCIGGVVDHDNAPARRPGLVQRRQSMAVVGDLDSQDALIGHRRTHERIRIGVQEDVVDQCR